jgi:hypothetical protein
MNYLALANSLVVGRNIVKANGVTCYQLWWLTSLELFLTKSLHLIHTIKQLECFLTPFKS